MSGQHIIMLHQQISVPIMTGAVSIGAFTKRQSQKVDYYRSYMYILFILVIFFRRSPNVSYAYENKNLQCNSSSPQAHIRKALYKRITFEVSWDKNTKQ